MPRFDELLAEKLRVKESSATEYGSSKTEENSHLLFTNYEAQRLNFLELGNNLSKFRASYRKSFCKPLPEFQLMVSEMNQKEQAAWEYFFNLGENLQQEFSERALKSSWRRLARKHHPDLNSEPTKSAPFVKVRESYLLLLKRFQLTRSGERRSD